MKIKPPKPTDPPPPPPPPPTGTIHLDFPTNPGPAGGFLGPDGAPNLLGFLRYESQGWPTPNERIRWAADPLGSSQIVTRFEVRDGDVASHYGGNRSEIFGTEDLPIGYDRWFTWSWLLGDGTTGDLFRQPSSWGVGMQNHGGTGSPPQAVEFNASQQLLIVRQRGDNSLAEGIPFAGYNRGLRQYFLMHVISRSDATGTVEFWHRVGSPIGATDPPTIVRTNVITSYAGSTGFSKIGLYRGDGASDAGTYPWVYYLYGYRQASDKATAIAKWG